MGVSLLAMRPVQALQNWFIQVPVPLGMFCNVSHIGIVLSANFASAGDPLWECLLAMRQVQAPEILKLRAGLYRCQCP